MRNSKEDVKQARTLNWNASPDGPHCERVLRPRYLMLLKHLGSKDLSGSVRITDQDWNERQSHNAMKNPPYVFGAHTKGQFGDSSDLDTLLKKQRKLLRELGSPLSA